MRWSTYTVSSIEMLSRMYSSGETFSESTENVKTDEYALSVGTWNKDAYTITARPEDMWEFGEDEGARGLYSELYLEFDGKVPLETFVFPGGVAFGDSSLGTAIGQEYFYTYEPSDYRTEVASTWSGYSLNRTKYISDYEKAYMEYSGKIPITAFEGAHAYNQYSSETDTTTKERDDPTYIQSEIASYYSKYVQELANIRELSLSVEWVSAVNGVYMTEYARAEYDVPIFTSVANSTLAMPSSVPSGDSSLSRVTSSANSKEKAKPSDHQPDAKKPDKKETPGDTKEAGRESSTSGEVVTSSQSKSAPSSTNPPPVSSKAKAALLTPLSSFVVLGLMMI
ncbi:hypothetical protein DICA0_E09362 [Diutina catenulata]